MGVACLVLTGTLAARSIGAGDADKAEVEILRRTSRAFSKVAKSAMPAVVFITVEKTVESQSSDTQWNDPFGFFGDDFFDRFFGGRPGAQPRQFKQYGQGSGFLISKDGYILTNNHVVGDADKITVKFDDGHEYQAKRVGTDPKSEVAVIKIDAKHDLPYLEAGDSQALEIGEWVIAVGNPFGLAETLTVGVVSAKGRSNLGIAEYEDFIQTDAAINPGNSGGPLLNIDGKVIGINAAILSRSGGYMGIGFAVPINLAMSVKDQLLKRGKVTRGFLGVQLNPQEVNEDMSKHFGMEKSGGVLIAEVVKDSPAEKAGLKSGDIILQLNGRDVEGNSGFRNTIAMTEPGKKMSITLFRDGKKKTIEAAVGTLPDDAAAAAQASEITTKLGFSVRDLTPELARRFGYDFDEGVIVDKVEPNSPALQAEIQPGALILSVNQRPVKNVTEFGEQLGSSQKEGRALLRVKYNRVSWYVLLRLE
jgi:serine protease Do